jgi:hypothetical protein
VDANPYHQNYTISQPHVLNAKLVFLINHSNFQNFQNYKIGLKSKLCKLAYYFLV